MSQSNRSYPSVLDRCEWALAQDVKGNAKYVLLYIAIRDGEKTGCTKGLRTIAREIGTAFSTVQKAVDQLLAKHLIRRVRQSDGGIESNSHRINMVYRQSVQGVPNDADESVQGVPMVGTKPEQPEPTRKEHEKSQTTDGGSTTKCASNGPSRVGNFLNDVSGGSGRPSAALAQPPAEWSEAKQTALLDLIDITVSKVPGGDALRDKLIEYAISGKMKHPSNPNALRRALVTMVRRNAS